MKKNLLTLVCSMAIISYLDAQTVSWDGGAGTTNWMDAMNWDTDIVPLATEDVLIDLSGSTIDLAGAASVIMVEVKNACTLNIASGASLTISGATADDGLETSGSGIIVNDGTIVISTSATDNIDGIYTKGTFTNNGNITVDGIGEHGLYVQGGSFTNNASGIITVTNVGTGSSDGDGVYLDDNGGTPGAFTNNGTLNVIMTATGDDGVYIKDASVFNNTSILDINCAAGNDMGLHLVNASAEFSNTGTVSITDAPDYGIQVDGANVTPPSFIDNAGTITVNGGANNGSSNDGLRMRRGGYVNNSGTFTFNGTGDESIQINDSDVGAVGFSVSTFDNSGTVDIINAFDHGMELFGNFNNLEGGVYQANGCADDGIRVQNSSNYNAVFTNNGTIRIDNSGNDDIETDALGNFVNSATAVFEPGSSPGDLEIRQDFDLGAATVTFEINGTDAATDYDQIVNGNMANTLTISSATANLVGGFTPSVGDEFKLVDGSGGVAGPWATITSDDPSIEFTVDYFGNSAETTFRVTAILPVKLVNFSAESTEKGNQLSWQTASEINNEGFEIERSTDGSDWTKIGYTNGNGESHALVSYSYLDNSPSIGTSYYRLKQMDYDGKYEYSNIVSVKAKVEKSKFDIYPNPVDNMLNIETDQELESAEYKLYDTNGKLLWKSSGVVSQISFEAYEKGIYFLEILSTNNRVVQKIIK